ncbi:helix-turn-helix domain-containing protein [Arthrobacter sp. MAHUQ-56]
MSVPSEPSRPLQYGKAIAKSDLPSGVKATCWALATFADNDTGEAWPKVKTLAKAAGLSSRVVSQHTGTAESAGYLRKKRRYDNSVLYTITVPTSEEAETHYPAVEAVQPGDWLADLADGFEHGGQGADN